MSSFIHVHNWLWLGQFGTRNLSSSVKPAMHGIISEVSTALTMYRIYFDGYQYHTAFQRMLCSASPFSWLLPIVPVLVFGNQVHHARLNEAVTACDSKPC